MLSKLLLLTILSASILNYSSIQVSRGAGIESRSQVVKRSPVVGNRSPSGGHEVQNQNNAFGVKPSDLVKDDDKSWRRDYEPVVVAPAPKELTFAERMYSNPVANAVIDRDNLLEQRKLKRIEDVSRLVGTSSR